MRKDVEAMSPEEIAEEVADRLRGGPRRRLKEFAADIGMAYDELMVRLTEYVEHGEYISEGSRFESVDFDLWDEFELVTGLVVPAAMRWSPFSCSC